MQEPQVFQPDPELVKKYRPLIDSLKKLVMEEKVISLVELPHVLSVVSYEITTVLGSIPISEFTKPEAKKE